MTSLIIQALKTLGRANATPEIIGTLSDKLTEADKKAMLKEAAESTDWVYDIIRKIVGGEKDTMRKISETGRQRASRVVPKHGR